MQDLSLFGGKFEFQTWSKVKTPVGEHISTRFIRVPFSGSFEKQSKIGNHNLYIFAVVY
jgi:hypothetical protein